MDGAMPAKSRSPLASPANFVAGSSTTAITSWPTRGGPPSAAGNASFRANTQRCPATRSTNLNGPFPTGARLNTARRMSARGTSRSRCAGKTGSSHSTSGNPGGAAPKRSTAVESSGVNTVSSAAKSPARAYPVRGSRAARSVNATSREVVGFPSCHRSPFTSRNVSSRRSALKLQDVAAYGSGASALSYRARVVNSANRCTWRESG